MRILLTPQIKEKIRELVGYAHANSIGLADMHRRVGNANIPPIGDNPKHTMDIPEGVRVTYSVEQHMLGMCRHISLSVLGDERVVHPAAALAICELFGFVPAEGEALSFRSFEHIWKEEFAPGRFAINLLQKIK